MRRRLKNGPQPSDQFFRSIFENVQIGITFFNIAGRAVFSNRALHQMLGYTAEERSRFEKWNGIIHPAERASGEERYAALVQGKRDKDEGLVLPIWSSSYAVCCARQAGRKHRYRLSQVSPDTTVEGQAENRRSQGPAKQRHRGNIDAIVANFGALIQGLSLSSLLVSEETIQI